MQVKGILTNLTPWRSGKNARGHWSVQNLDLQFNGQKTSVTVWCRPDLSSARGKLVTLDGVEEGKNNKGNEILELRDGKGDVNVMENPSSIVPTSTIATSSDVPAQYSRRVKTVEEYEAVLARAIKFVAIQFRPGGGVAPDFQAVAHVVNGYMVAYSKGDFEVSDRLPQEVRDIIAGDKNPLA